MAKDFLIKWLVNIAALVITVNIAPGIHSNGWETTVIAALVLGFVNAFLRPILIFLTLPLTVLSLGFFTLFLNGFMLYLVSKIVKNFVVADFWSAFWGALCFSVASFFVNVFIVSRPTVKAYRFHDRSCRKSDHGNVIDVCAKVEDNDITRS
ncbi:MAG: phage holin family protein [Candidatus Omnitrophota bacterium]